MGGVDRPARACTNLCPVTQPQRAPCAPLRGRCCVEICPLCSSRPRCAARCAFRRRVMRSAGLCVASAAQERGFPASTAVILAFYCWRHAPSPLQAPRRACCPSALLLQAPSAPPVCAAGYPRPSDCQSRALYQLRRTRCITAAPARRPCWPARPPARPPGAPGPARQGGACMLPTESCDFRG